MAETAHSFASGTREKMLERLLIGSLQKHLWINGRYDLEVLHAETDNAGYDIVLALNEMMRHVQLKASFLGAKTSRVDIGVSLKRKPSGCVIWIWFDPETLELDHFLFFGDPQRGPLPDLGDKVAKHSKGDRLGNKAQRPNLRTINKGRFRRIEHIADLATELFGG